MFLLRKKKIKIHLKNLFKIKIQLEQQNNNKINQKQIKVLSKQVEVNP
jgi:hypothetical protein